MAKSKIDEGVIKYVIKFFFRGLEKKLLKDKNYLDNILEKGAKRADLIAKNNLKDIYKILGLRKFT